MVGGDLLHAPDQRGAVREGAAGAASPAMWKERLVQGASQPRIMRPDRADKVHEPAQVCAVAGRIGRRCRGLRVTRAAVRLLEWSTMSHLRHHRDERVIA